MSIKIYQKDGTKQVLDGVAQDERIREYMQEHGCSYEEAAIIVMDIDEQTNVQMMRQNPDLIELNGSFYAFEGKDSDSEIRKYQMENDCSLADATIHVLDRKER